MVGVNRQRAPNSEPIQDVPTEHEFVIRPDPSPSFDLSASSIVDRDAHAIIGEFQKFEGKTLVACTKEVGLLLDHIDSPTIRTYLIDCLRISPKSHFELSEVRAEIFRALSPYVDQSQVQLVCVQEFRRRMRDAISCSAASEALTHVTAWNGSEIKEFCLTLIKENSETIGSLSSPPGIIGALRVLGKSPELTRVDQEVSACIKAYRAGMGNVSRLDVLAAIGTDKTWAVLAKIADQRLAPKWSLSPDDHTYLNKSQGGLGAVVYGVGSIGIGSALAAVEGVAIYESLQSTLLGVVAGIAIFGTGFLLPTLVPAIFNSIFKRKGVNPTMREHALSLIANHQPDFDHGQIVIRAMAEKGRSTESLKDLATALTKAQSPNTLINIANLIESGPSAIRLTLLKTFAQSKDPAIRMAITKSKNDLVMEISDEATKIAAGWRE